LHHKTSHACALLCKKQVQRQYRVHGGAVVREFRPRHDHIELSPLNPRHREYRIPNLTPEILIGVVIETTRHRD